MPKLENSVSITFTRDEVEEVLRQAAMKRFGSLTSRVRIEDVTVGIYATDVAGAPYFACVTATIFSEDWQLASQPNQPA